MKVFIAEKPSLARAIADGLGAPKPAQGYINTASGDMTTGNPEHRRKSPRLP